MKEIKKEEIIIAGETYFNTQCNICGEFFTRHGLIIHKARKHPLPEWEKELEILE